MNHLIFWKDLRLFLGKNPRPTIGHSHPVLQLVVAIDDTFKTKVPETEEWTPKKGLLIKPNYQHQCDASDVAILSLDIDPDTTLGEWILLHILENNPILDYPSEQYGQIDVERIKNLIQAKNWDALHDHILQVFRFEKKQRSIPKEERISKVVNYIHEHIHEKLSTEILKRAALLSESRLLHLFKEEMGLPIRNYILWYRLKVALDQVMNGASLTEAAHRAGFSDQPHFTRTCLKMVGVPPSTLVKNSKFIQVFFSSK